MDGGRVIFAVNWSTVSCARRTFNPVSDTAKRKQILTPRVQRSRAILQSIQSCSREDSDFETGSKTLFNAAVLIPRDS